MTAIGGVSALVALVSTLGVLAASDVNVLCDLRQETRVSVIGAWRSDSPVDDAEVTSWWGDYPAFAEAREVLESWDHGGKIGVFVANDDESLVVVVAPSVDNHSMDLMQRQVEKGYPTNAPPLRLVRGCFEPDRVAEVSEELTTGEIGVALKAWFEAPWESSDRVLRRSSVTVSAPSGGHVVLALSHYPPGLQHALLSVLGVDSDLVRIVMLTEDASPPWSRFMAVENLADLEAAESELPSLGTGPREASDEPATAAPPAQPFNSGSSPTIGGSDVGQNSGAAPLALGIAAMAGLAYAFFLVRRRSSDG